MNLIALAAEVGKIARRAGEAVLGIYEQAKDYQVEAKADDSPLTLADRTANRIICEGLAELEEQFPIISEENKEVPYGERSGYEYFWLVDPLDGTKEFIKRNGEFTINIALIHRKRPVLGVVYVPVPNELFWGVERAGAFAVRRNGEIERLNALTFKRSDKGLKIVASRSHRNEATDAFIATLNRPETVARGSSVKFLALASGEAHIYPRLAPTMEWDTAAAQIVLQEAGGRVVVEGTEEPLRYNKESLRNPGFIAYAREE